MENCAGPISVASLLEWWCAFNIAAPFLLMFALEFDRAFYPIRYRPKSSLPMASDGGRQGPDASERYLEVQSETLH